MIDEIDIKQSALKLLKRFYGFDSFRSIQYEVIEQVMRGGDALVLMPTGGGKSVCYQIPALNFRGTPCGIDVMKVVESGVTPILNTAIASNRAGVGMVGAGMSTLPIEPFKAALLALAEEMGI